MGAGNPMYGKVTSEETKQKIREANSGEKHWRWQGGRYVDAATGYVYIQVKGHPQADAYGYILEHRVLVEAEIGRYLGRDEHVHHRNPNPTECNNDIKNLQLMTASEHQRHHRRTAA